MPAAPATRRNVWHEVPRPTYRGDDAIRHCRYFAQALQPWFESALAGELRFTPAGLAPGGAKTHDDIVADCATALATAVEWDGYLLAKVFEARGWPADADLVGRCSRWSCQRKRDRIEAWRRQEAAKAAGRNPAPVLPSAGLDAPRHSPALRDEGGPAPEPDETGTNPWDPQ